MTRVQFFITILMRFATHLLGLLGSAHALASFQDTIYLYKNRTVYAHVEEDGQDTIFEIPFNQGYTAGTNWDVKSLSVPNGDDCKLVGAEFSLLAFCSANNGTTLQVKQYNSALDVWTQLPIDSSISYYVNTSYIHSMSDPRAIYMFSGVDPSTSELSTRMLKLDLNSMEVTNAVTSVQPAPFQQASTLEINSNTELLFGGLDDSGFLQLGEIPVWQYNGWAERPCETSDSPLNGTANAIVLPVFDKTNQFAYNGTADVFDVSSVLVLGSDATGDSILGSLNVSSYVWEWSDKTGELASAQQTNTTTFDLNLALAVVTIYDTLFVVSKSGKRDSQGYSLGLYNANDFSEIDSVNYSTFQKEHTNSSHTVNKSLIIALSVIIPVLMIIIVLCAFTYYYRRYKQRKQDELNEKEVTAIVDFYQNQNKQASETTFGTDTTLNDSLPSSASNVVINNYDDGDNISINRPKESFSTTILRTLSKKLPPVPKHVSLTPSLGQEGYLNHIPENSSISTFLTGSTRQGTHSTPRSHKSSRSKSISSYASESEDQFSQKSTKMLPYQLSNKSDGSLDETAYNSSLMNMMRRMSSKRVSSKLRITNPDTIHEETEECDKQSIVDMTQYIPQMDVQFEDPFAQLNTNLFRGDSLRLANDPFKDTATDLFRGNSLYCSADPFRDMSVDVMRGSSVKKMQTNPFKNMSCDVFRGNSIYQRNDDPFTDMASDVFRGNSVYFKGKRNSKHQEVVADPFQHLSSNIFRGDSLRDPIGKRSTSTGSENETHPKQRSVS